MTVSADASKTGGSWQAPAVIRSNVSTAYSDRFFTGQYDLCTFFESGEVVPGPSIVSHHMVYGQSLALGSRGFMRDAEGNVLFVEGVSGTVFSTTDSTHGVLSATFQSGPRTNGTYTSFIATKEAFDGNVLGESVCSALLNKRNDWVLNGTGTRQRLLGSVSGLGGTAYVGLKKGTAPYDAAIAAVTGGKKVARTAGYKHHVPAIFIIHGESEGGSLTAATYAGYLLEWITDFSTDITAITGQSIAPVMLVSQMNRQKSTNEGVPLGQLLAHEDNANIILLGPKYQHLYYDDAHMLAEGYVKQGELGERALRHWTASRKWQPLRPVTVVGAANVITIQFNNTVSYTETTAGPVGALALDTSVVTNPGDYGFRCTDGGVSVSSVALGGDGTSVVITLSGTPAGGSSIEYAMQSSLNLAEMPSGQNTGSRGNLRDGDTRDLSRFDGTALYNWCVAFRKAIA